MIACENKTVNRCIEQCRKAEFYKSKGCEIIGVEPWSISAGTIEELAEKITQQCADENKEILKYQLARFQGIWFLLAIVISWKL